MTAASDQTIPTVRPRAHPPGFWRARLGALASRGETDGPRVEEARAALAWWRHRTFLIRETDVTEAQADELLDLIDRHTAEGHTCSATAAAR
jgi:hypothetical protein